MMTPEERKPQYYGRPVNRRLHPVYDFEICFGEDGLKRCLADINCSRFEIVAVTQTMDKYTIFFRRLPV